jgi:hypothetical protein
MWFSTWQLTKRKVVKRTVRYIKEEMNKSFVWPGLLPTGRGLSNPWKKRASRWSYCLMKKGDRKAFSLWIILPKLCLGEKAWESRTDWKRSGNDAGRNQARKKGWRKGIG